MLQYLDWADLQKYMKAIAENRENLTHDPEYLHTFHREHLAVVKGGVKKTAGYVLEPPLRMSVLMKLFQVQAACAMLPSLSCGRVPARQCQEPSTQELGHRLERR